MTDSDKSVLYFVVGSPFAFLFGGMLLSFWLK